MKNKGIIASVIAIGFIIGIIFLWNLISEITLNKSGIIQNNEDFENRDSVYDKLIKDFKLLYAQNLKLNEYKNKQVETLNYAIIHGYYDMVKFMIETGAEINTKDDGNNSPLWMSIKYDQKEITELLLGNGADINKNEDRPIVYQALYNEDLELAKELIKNGVNVNAVTEDGEQAIHEASWQGWNDIIILLVNNGADINALVDNGFYKGSSPLHFACEYGRTDTIMLLLDLGADITVRNSYKQTLLHHVGITGQYGVAKLLLKKGLNVNSIDNIGATPLLYAALYENKSVENLFKKHNGQLVIDESAKDYTTNKTTIHLVAEMGDKNLAERLLNSGMDINVRDSNGLTPLHYAIIYNQTDIAQILINNGAELGIGDNEGKSPLHHASLYGREYLAEMLIEEGADINHKNRYDKTPLHYVGLYGNMDLTTLLLKNGAYLNAVDRYGATPLLYSSIYGASGTSKILSNNGAKLFVEGVSLYYDGMGLSPLHLSVRYDNYEITRQLIEKGVNIESKTVKGETPLHYAVRFDRPDIAKLLLNNRVNVNPLSHDFKTPLDMAMEKSNYTISFTLKRFGGVTFSKWRYLNKLIFDIFKKLFDKIINW